MATKQTSFKNSPLYQKGHRGELIIKQILQERGYYVIPSYDYSGKDEEKAPKLYGINQDFVIPDLDISKQGKRLWAEVKTKKSATFTRKTQRYEHGIPLIHYNHYLEVQSITGCDIWLYIYEENTHLVLRAKLDNLPVRIYEGNKMSWGGMAFFPKSEFEEIGFYIGGMITDNLSKLKETVISMGELPIPVIRDKINKTFDIDCSPGDVNFLRHLKTTQAKTSSAHTQRVNQ